MGVLLFLLGALKVIGIILLIVLLLILFLLTIVVSTPIKYKIKVEKLDQLVAIVRITYLFGLVRVIFKYDDSVLKYKMKIFFKKYYKSLNLKGEEKGIKNESTEDKKPAEDKKTSQDIKSIENIKPKQFKKIEKEVKEVKEVKKEVKKEEVKEEIKSIKVNKDKKDKNPPKDKKPKKPKKPKKDKKPKKPKKEINIMKKINEIRNLSYIDDIIKDVKTFLKKLFKHILPRKLSVVGQLGRENPDQTGQIFGILGIINGFSGKNIKIKIKGNFEKEILEGKLYTEGKIRICYLVYISVILLIKKSTRRFIKFIKAEF